MIGALLCLAAATLTMIGVFQDLVVVENLGGPQDQTLRLTLWDARLVTDGVTETAPELGGPSAPQNGVPLLLAVALLLAAALLGRLNLARRLSRASGLAAVVAATFLTAAVAVVITQAVWWMDVLAPVPLTPQEGVDVEITVSAGPAVWTLVAGVALAIVAAVLTWRQPRLEPERVEPDTPRMGLPVMVRRLPDEPPDAEN
jgi:hypothetical protein